MTFLERDKSMSDRKRLQIVYLSMLIVVMVQGLLTVTGNDNAIFNMLWVPILLWAMVYVTFTQSKTDNKNVFYFYVFLVCAVVLTGMSLFYIFS